MSPDFLERELEAVHARLEVALRRIADLEDELRRRDADAVLTRLERRAEEIVDLE